MDRDKTIQILMRQLEELNRRIIWLEKGNKALRSENALLKTENALLKAENVELKAKTAVMEDKKGMKGKPFDRLSSPIKQSFVYPTFAAVDMDLQKKNWNWQKGARFLSFPRPGLRLPNIRYLRAGVPFAGKSKKELRRMESMPRFNIATMQRRWLYC